ncbi:SH3 domain-containing protein [Cellulophaga sp. E16_2]|uniref:Tetratricopeptide TPR_1 repeat-containing protein n=1 Tax=Cellulophaga algicola (strain DSM 14237 / IC166 / ACAM 630) TaxID=688270 RepID=E6X7A9_CELAD|nr:MULTISPECIES: tetratricopeptide repeat protein [Cellulophaga]ADV48562.1 Tetratricopeptide TPR_1 repeat-containing protein [Cellulophaga algicola DSM 14237]MBO0590980.1 SH3 domain-containing protein [Cellulophaga sp. E16_2]
MKKILFIFILFIGFLGYSQNAKLFDAANTAYNDGKYEVAEKTYLKIVDNGEASSELYFNLGNVYYKENKIAPSIYYYEKALLLKPNDSDIKNNLAYAQNMTLDAITTAPETGFAKLYKNTTSFFSFEQWAYSSVILMFLFVLAYLLYYFLANATLKRISFISSLVFLVIALASIALAYLKYGEFKDDQPAIVFEKESSIQAEPNGRSTETFKLHEGTKVMVLETLNDWSKIKIPDGKTGWIPTSEIKMLKDI